MILGKNAKRAKLSRKLPIPVHFFNVLEAHANNNFSFKFRHGRRVLSFKVECIERNKKGEVEIAQITVSWRGRDLIKMNLSDWFHLTFLGPYGHPLL